MEPLSGFDTGRDSVPLRVLQFKFLRDRFDSAFPGDDSAPWPSPASRGRECIRDVSLLLRGGGTHSRRSPSPEVWGEGGVGGPRGFSAPCYPQILGRRGGCAT